MLILLRQKDAPQASILEEYAQFITVCYGYKIIENIKHVRANIWLRKMAKVTWLS